MYAYNYDLQVYGTEIKGFVVRSKRVVTFFTEVIRGHSGRSFKNSGRELISSEANSHSECGLKTSH